MKRFLMVLIGLLAATPIIQAQAPTPIFPPQDAGRVRLLTLLRHESPITQAFFSPSGRFFVTGTLNGQLNIWSSDWQAAQLPGTALARLDGYLPGVTVVSFDQDERRMAAALGMMGTTIQIYRLPVAQPIVQFEGHTLPLVDIHFADRLMLSRDLLDTLMIWDAQSGDLYQQLDGIIALDIKGTQAAILDSDGAVGALNLNAPDQPPLPIGGAGMRGVRFSPGGRWLAAWGRSLAVWDWNSGNLLFQTDDLRIDNVLWSPDGRFLVTSDFADAKVWAVEDEAGALVDEFAVAGGQGGLKRLVISADGQRLVTVDRTDGARLWQFTPAGDARQITALPGIVDDVLLSPDSQTLATFRQDFTTRFWDARTGDLRGEARLPGDVIFSPDWSLLASYQGNWAAWRGLPKPGVTFDNAPIGRPARRANIRVTPSEEVQRLIGIDSDQFLFAIGRTADSNWFQIVLEDGSTGWAARYELALSASEDRLAALPVVPTGRTQAPAGVTLPDFWLAPEPMPFEGITSDTGIRGCAPERTVVILEASNGYTRVDCGGAIGWLPDEYLRRTDP